MRENPVDGSSSAVTYPYEKNNASYSTLNNKQQALYEEMLPKIKDRGPFEYTAEKDGYDVLGNVLIAASALCQDHPEYEIYFDITEVFDGDITMALHASYFLPYNPDATPLTDTEPIKKEVQIFEETCRLIVDAIPKDFSTYDKYRHLATLISLMTSYDTTFTGGKPSANAYGAIEGGVSICQGYATALNTFAAKQICGVRRSAVFLRTYRMRGT